MLAVIRTCPKRAAHCHRTIENLMRSNGPRDQRIVIVSSTKKPNFNGLDTIQAGIDCSGGKPFIFLEDDVEFIADFDAAAEQFYLDCEGAPGSFIPLCANYTDAMNKCRGIAWTYPLRNFYGSQAFLISSENAKQFIEWAKKQKVKDAGFDLLIKDWAMDRGDKSVRTPYVSFVQHMGVDSALHNGRFHYYPTWPGSDWRYTSSAFSLKEQQNRPCDTALAARIADFFGPTLPAYDFGCSTGRYVKELLARRINAIGFDATPGIGSEIVVELDLARPQRFEEPQGNVMCLEVAEHIHPDKEKHLLANIKTLCAGKLVLSWAIPGQGGRRHVNEQQSEYVARVIEAQGFTLHREESLRMRQSSTLSWFKNTVFAFEKRLAPIS